MGRTWNNWCRSALLRSPRKSSSARSPIGDPAREGRGVRGSARQGPAIRALWGEPGTTGAGAHCCAHRGSPRAQDLRSEILRAKVAVCVDLHVKARQLERYGENLEQLVQERTAALTAEVLERKISDRRSCARRSRCAWICTSRPGN